jgi:hypothetical protein
MRLTTIVDYLINPSKLDELYEREGLNSESDTLLIYMSDTLDIHSEIQFFDMEETEDELVYQKNGMTYVQLFPVEYAIELIDDLDLRGKNYTDSEIARRLIEYRIKDA